LLGGGDDLVLAVDADLAAIGIDLDHHVLGGVRVAPIRRLDRLLERLDEDLLGDPLLGVQLKEGADEVSIHGAPRFRGRKNRTWDGEPTHVRAQLDIDLVRYKRPATPREV